jgi:hypothetical protein
MRSRLFADLPLARYSVWCLMILLGGILLNYLDRIVHDLMQDIEPHVFFWLNSR